MEQNDEIAELVLNYPSNSNALSGRMLVQLHDAAEQLEDWESGKGLIFYGAKNKGNFFCSGGHLQTGKILIMIYTLKLLMNGI